MNWGDERYVRIYTRNTPEWMCLSFPAQGLFCLLLRVVDRAGVLQMGKLGRRAVAVAIGFPGEWSRLEPALDELLTDGCVQVVGDHLIVRNFIEAQEAESTNAERCRKAREKRRDQAQRASLVTQDASPRHGETASHVVGDAECVTDDAAHVKNDTPSRTVPSVPPVPAAEAPARLPTREERQAARWPHATSVAARCAEAWGHPVSLPKTETDRGTVEEAARVFGTDPVVQICLTDVATAVESGRLEETPGSLGWCVKALHRALAHPPERRKVFTGVAADGFTPVFKERAP